MDTLYDWRYDIAPRINRMELSNQGFTAAQTGLVRLSNGTQVFVKCAMDDNSAYWVKKEIKTYKLLQDSQYDHISKLVSIGSDGMSFALEDLSHCDFSDTWDEDKLHAVMRARKDLKSLQHLFEDDNDFSMRNVVGVQDRWPMLTKPEVLLRANDVLKGCGETLSIDQATVKRCSETMRTWQIHQNTLVHDDLRADNFAYDPRTKTGKLIDWSWLCIGDDTLDATSLFVSATKSGFDVYARYPELFDERAIVSILGYWLEVLASSDGTITAVRRSQAVNVRACYELLAQRTQLVG